MKYCISIIILLYVLGSAKGQQKIVLNEPNHDDKAIHFGFCIGLNSMNFVTHTNFKDGLNADSLVADVSKPTVGFHIQIVSNYRLGKYFDLRFLPGVSFSQRTINFFKKNQLVTDVTPQRLESNFLEFPFLIKYKAKRTSNVRPYMITGTNLRLDLAKTLSESDDIYIALHKLDLYYEAGAGLDFYLPFFKLSTELKLSYGFFNVLKRKPSSETRFQNSIERLNSSIWMLSFHFE
ncbi:MAG: porin family protein [Bacteroidota bacterium]|nr:porin family protein [Bacteroidota bacterium]